MRHLSWLAGRRGSRAGEYEPTPATAAPRRLSRQVLRVRPAAPRPYAYRMASRLARAPAEGLLRRGDRRRGRARPCRRVLPRRQPWDHRRRGAGQGLRGLGWLGPEHRDPAVQLPDARGSQVLRPLDPVVPAPGHRSRLQRDVLAAGAPDPGPQRRLAAHHALARRGQQGQGVHSEVIGPAEIKRLAPFLDVGAGARYPILGALWHPPGGIIRHDAVVWGYARGADALGVHIHQNTEVTGIDVADGRVRGVRTSRGDIATRVVLNATAGWATLISSMAGVAMPIETSPLQAAVTEPVKPFLSTVIVSGTLHVYISQTDR